MKISVEKVREEGSCNYCDKSELKADGMGLDYPYDKVIDVRGHGIKTRFCFECFEKLKKYEGHF